MGAAATVAGQNLGAHRPERALQGVRVSASLGLGLAAAIGVLFLTIPRSLLGLFGMTDPVVVGLGVQLLRFLSLSGLFVTVALAYTGGLQGTGDTRSPLYISIVSQIVVPLGLCSVLQATRGLHAADIWTAILLGHERRVDGAPAAGPVADDHDVGDARLQHYPARPHPGRAPRRDVRPAQQRLHLGEPPVGLGRLDLICVHPVSLGRRLSLWLRQARLIASDKKRETRRSVGGSRVAHVLSLNPGVGWVAAVILVPARS